MYSASRRIQHSGRVLHPGRRESAIFLFHQCLARFFQPRALSGREAGDAGLRDFFEQRVDGIADFIRGAARALRGRGDAAELRAALEWIELAGEGGELDRAAALDQPRAPGRRAALRPEEGNTEPNV